MIKLKRKCDKNVKSVFKKRLAATLGGRVIDKCLREMAKVMPPCCDCFSAVKRRFWFIQELYLHTYKLRSCTHCLLIYVCVYNSFLIVIVVRHLLHIALHIKEGASAALRICGLLISIKFVRCTLA